LPEKRKRKKGKKSKNKITTMNFLFSGTMLALIALLIGFLVSFKSIPAIIKVSRLKGLMDAPDGERKLHKNIVPNLGGVGIFAGFIISYGICIGFELPKYFPALMSSVTILFFVGIKDDILVIAPYKKLAGQIVAAAIVVFIGKIYIPGLDGLFGIHTFHPLVGQAFSMAAIIFIINAYNLIDGIDGLAGMLAILASYAFGLWFLVGGHYAEAILCFSLSGALIGFMIHNFEPARIFMGDTGSLIVGLLISVAAFRLVQLNPGTTGLTLNNPLMYVLSVMIIPVFDTLRVIAVRMSRGTSPMKADSNHIHHLFLRMGLRHYQATLILAFFNASIVIISLFMQSWNIYLYLIVLTAMAASIIPIMSIAREALLRTFSLRSEHLPNDFLLDNIGLQDLMVELNSKGPGTLKMKNSLKKEEYSLEMNN
jgi:UDP-GlcNAc:undecaprenyl-phosphate/decaprenyl-phosphate GlcNAc-1-phosphate transferase